MSAHSQAALYQRFVPAEARRILSRLEFHFTPKHVSWLNMVEIEIGVTVRQCLNSRIGDKPTLISEMTEFGASPVDGEHPVDASLLAVSTTFPLRDVYPVCTARPASRAIKTAA